MPLFFEYATTIAAFIKGDLKMVKKVQKDHDFEQLVVDVTTALPLEKKQSDKIIQLVSDALNVKTVLLNIKVDKQILGGFQLQIGSSFIDVSVRKKISEIQKILEKNGLKKNDARNFRNFFTRFERW